MINNIFSAALCQFPFTWTRVLNVSEQALSKASPSTTLSLLSPRKWDVSGNGSSVQEQFCTYLSDTGHCSICSFSSSTVSSLLKLKLWGFITNAGSATIEIFYRGRPILRHAPPSFSHSPQMQSIGPNSHVCGCPLCCSVRWWVLEDYYIETIYLICVCISSIRLPANMECMPTLMDPHFDSFCP